MSDIVLRNIFKSFDGKTVLNDISVTFPEGSISCVMGPSGCGKTTLLRIIAGLESYDSGSVCGVPSKKGFVFQEDRLCEDFTAESNIRLVCGKSMSRTSIRKHLEALGLNDISGKPVREFSGGMKRRVAIARAICSNAEIVLMDEPFKGLDETNKTAVIDYVKTNTAGKTVIIVTHDASEAELLCGNVITPWQ